MKRHYHIAAFLFSLLCGIVSGCTLDPMEDEVQEEELHGLVLELTVDNNPAVTSSSASTRAAADPTLNENLVKEVDVFFSDDRTNVDSHIHATLGSDNRIVLAGADWRQTFSAASYDVYVIANRHDDNTDLSGISTIEELMALTDTDVDVYKVEGESISTSETYSGKTFLMDGHTVWTSPATDDATIAVDLNRAAAKIVVNVSYKSSEGFDLEKLSLTSPRKKVVNYATQAVAFTDSEYKEPEIQGDASSDGFMTANVTSGDGENRKDILYAYSYPNRWGGNIERETYILMNIPYVDDNNDYQNNYYKVPVRISSDTDELRLDRNMQYTVNVTVDRKGNAEIDEPIELESPTFNVAEWKTETINVDNDSPNYLVLSDYNIEMHNEEEVTIEFFSSSPLAAENLGVQITEAYYVDKDGENRETQNYYYINRWGSSVETARSNVEITDLCDIVWDENTLTGTITFKSEFIKEYQNHDDILAATNITARYFTLLVTNTDNPATTQTVKITQYPLEYIMGVPGWYSTRSDFNADWEDHGDLTGVKTQFYSRPTVSNNIFSSKYYFEQKGWNTKQKYIYTYIPYKPWTQDYYTIEQGDNQGNQNNNRMYLVQLTSTNSEYTIARPETDYEGGQLITVDNEENNQLVSPAFMLASQLGTVSSGISWGDAKEQCKNYVEVIKFSDNDETYRLDDWRLPTYQELSIIADYQKRQPQVLDEVLRGSQYWTACQGVYYNVPNPTTSGRGVRCIRDVTPADLEEFAKHGIR